jgi:hypothetical protein
MRTFLALLFLPVLAFGQTNYYASPSASSGNGTIGNPWTLTQALAASGTIGGDDTLNLRGGTFNNPTSGQNNGDPRTGFKAWIMGLSGSAGHPIIIRSYPGEWAVLDGLDTKTEDIFHVSGHHVWIMNIEIMSSDTRRSATTPVDDTSYPDPGDIKRGTCINFNNGVNTAGIKFINCVIHDGFVGCGNTWENSTDTEWYGCVVYNNGWDTPGDRPHGHNFYIQNFGTTSIRKVADCLLWGAFENNVQAYGSADGGIERCNDFQFYGNASTKDGGEGNVYLVGGGSRVNRLIFDHNFSYTNNGQTNFGWAPYGSGLNSSTITNNYFVGGGGRWQGPLGVTFSGNYVYWPSGTDGVFSQGAFPSNTYASSRPNAVFVRQNAYAPARANIIIYNGSGSSSVTVTVGGIIANGSPYQVRDAMNWHGSPVASGTYNGSTVSIPMGSLSSVEQPYGGGGSTGTRTHTAPYFGMFVITGDAAGSAPLAPGAPTATGATWISSSSFTASWGAVSGANGYRLDVATDNGFTSMVSGYSNLNVGNVTSATVSGLSPTTIYYYRVRAYNDGGTSSSSNVITTNYTQPATKATGGRLILR